MSEEIAQLNEEAIKGQIKELVRGSVEEALIEMYGVSVRRVEDITEVLWGSKVSPATISELNKKAYVHIKDSPTEQQTGAAFAVRKGKKPVNPERWRLRQCEPFTGFLTRGGEFENVAILVAIAVNEDGYREVPGAAEGMKEDKASWVSFFQWLRGRGMDGVKLVVAELREMKLQEAAKKIEAGIEETLTYFEFPAEHWTRIRTNTVIERLNQEIRHRTRVVGVFPDGNSALMLVCARLHHVAGTQWGNRKYMNMRHLEAALEDASLAG